MLGQGGVPHGQVGVRGVDDLDVEDWSALGAELQRRRKAKYLEGV